MHFINSSIIQELASQNYYHKIIGSNILGFNDFSILNIEGLYLDELKGTYENFSQFLFDIPEELFSEKFIVWEGFVYSFQELNNNKNSTDILFFEGRYRKIQEHEILNLIKNPQLKLIKE